MKKKNSSCEFGGGRVGVLLILLFVLELTLLLDVKLRLFPLFFVTFIFLSNVSHDDYSFLVGLSSYDRISLVSPIMTPILPLVT